MKPREFWITFEGDPCKDKSELRWVSFERDESTMGFEVIHAREVIPDQELNIENMIINSSKVPTREQQLNKYTEFEAVINETALIRLKKLEQVVKVYEAALEHYRFLHTYHCANLENDGIDCVCDQPKIALEALEQGRKLMEGK